MVVSFDMVCLDTHNIIIYMKLSLIGNRKCVLFLGGGICWLVNEKGLCHPACSGWITFKVTLFDQFHVLIDT